LARALAETLSLDRLADATLVLQEVGLCSMQSLTVTIIVLKFRGSLPISSTAS